MELNENKLKCTDTLITIWKNIGFDDPKAFLDRIRTGRPEVSIKIEKAVLRKTTNKILVQEKQDCS